MPARRGKPLQEGERDDERKGNLRGVGGVLSRRFLSVMSADVYNTWRYDGLANTLILLLRRGVRECLPYPCDHDEGRPRSIGRGRTPLDHLAGIRAHRVCPRDWTDATSLPIENNESFGIAWSSYFMATLPLLPSSLANVGRSIFRHVFFPVQRCFFLIRPLPRPPPRAPRCHPLNVCQLLSVW